MQRTGLVRSSHHPPESIIMAGDRRAHQRVVLYRAEVPETGEIREVEYPAIADALHFACRDLREERRRPLEIIEDGVVVYDAESIPEACQEKEAEFRDRGVS